MRVSRNASWLALATQTTRLALESQEVVALRMVRLAQGGPRAAHEATRMVAEKIAALARVQLMLIGAAASAGQARAPARILAMYRRKVRANRRRLRKG